MTLLGPLIIILIILFNYFFLKDMLYPALIHSILWFCVTIFYFLNNRFLPKISFKTMVIIVTGVIFFSIGSFIMNFNHKPNKRKIIPYIHNIEVYKYVLNFFLIISIIGLPFYLYRAYNLMISGPYNNLFINLRYILNYTEKGYGFLMRFGVLSRFTTLMFAVLYFRSKSKSVKYKMFISINVSILYALFSTGRTSILSFLISLIFIGLIMRKLKIGRAFMLLLFIILVIFASYSIILDKGGSLNYSIYKNINNVYKSFTRYFIGPIISFDYLNSKNINFTVNGSHVFRTVFKLLSIFGFNVEVVDLVRESVPVKYSTNVYTIYGTYFRDYSILGTIFFQFLFGLFHGFLYRKVTVEKVKVSYIYLYSIFMFPLFMQFFQDQYFTLLSAWIQYALLLFLIAILQRLKYWRIKSSL